MQPPGELYHLFDILLGFDTSCLQLVDGPDELLHVTLIKAICELVLATLQPRRAPIGWTVDDSQRLDCTRLGMPARKVTTSLDSTSAGKRPGRRPSK